MRLVIGLRPYTVRRRHFKALLIDILDFLCKQQVPGLQEDGSKLLYRFILQRRGSWVVD